MYQFFERNFGTLDKELKMLQEYTFRFLKKRFGKGLFILNEIL